MGAAGNVAAAAGAGATVMGTTPVLFCVCFGLVLAVVLIVVLVGLDYLEDKIVRHGIDDNGAAVVTERPPGGTVRADGPAVRRSAVERLEADRRDRERLAELDAALFERDRLREALAPFAGVKVSDRAPAGDDAIGWFVDEAWALKVADFRRAAEVYGAGGGSGGEPGIAVTDRAG